MTSLIRRLSQRGRLHTAGTATCSDEDARQPQVIAGTESLNMLITAGCSAGRSVEYHQVLLHLHTPAVGAHRLRVTFLSPIILLLLGGLIDVKETTCVSNGERGHWQKKLTLFGKAEETQIKQMLLIPPIESYSGLLETIRPRHTRGLSNLWNIWNFKTKQSLHQGSVVTASLLSAQHPNQRATVQLLRVRLYKSL